MDEPGSFLDIAEKLLIRTRMMRAGDQPIIGMPDDSAIGSDDMAAEEQAAASAQIDMVTLMLKQVNDYLATALADLDRVKSDLRNLIEITGLAAVFVDNRLNIKRFTPPLTAIYDVSLADIGTPLSQVSANLRYPELSADFARICEGERLVEKQLVSADGKSQYLMRMRAYHVDDGSTDGVAIVFSNLPDKTARRASVRQPH